MTSKENTSNFKSVSGFCKQKQWMKGGRRGEKSAGELGGEAHLKFGTLPLGKKNVHNWEIWVIIA